MLGIYHPEPLKAGMQAVFKCLKWVFSVEMVQYVFLSIENADLSIFV